MLVLFITYQASIAAFTHVHNVNGVLISHSHPFQSSHSHSESSLIAIGQLSTFCSPEVDVYELQHPLRALLAVLESAPESSTAKGEEIRAFSLRAPPFFVL